MDRKFISAFVMSILTLFFMLNCDARPLTELPKPVSLFNGINLEGWRHVGNGQFSVENGLLKSEGGMGLLYYYKQMFGDVKIRIVYKTTYPTTNSGIFVRIAHAPRDVWDGVDNGFEIQICDSGDDAFDGYHRTGAIYSLAKSTKVASFSAGQWNTYEITLRKSLIDVYLNGVKVTSFDSDKPARARLYDSDPVRGRRPLIGYIGIQNHDHNARQQDSHIYIKEITVLPLNG